MLRVKICGITNLEDASFAVRLGVHALGFILSPSPRQVSPEAVREIVRGIPPLVQTVGVFVNEAPSRVREIMGFCGLDLAQLHGDESPADCEALTPRAIKALRLRDESSLAVAATYRGKVRAVLLDSYVKGRRGGTGTTLDWDLAARGLELGIPVILAGGLNPGNVRRAVSVVRPFAIDVNSGVEERPGRKSPALMDRLMEVVRNLRVGEMRDE
ncbi:MAG TPA: phosphoribosylanthranilate isomerase [Syntrophobacteria bacterium]|nr:phosphoribosylanthranilate isomerase [Syntrophobacteria bacterium]